MKQNTIVEIISALLVLLFVYTGLSKLLDHRTFTAQLIESHVFKNISNILAWVLPIGEVIISFLLVFKITQLIGLYISAGLLFLFTLYLIYMVSHFKDLPCTCGGVIAKMSWTQHILFNSSCLVLCIIAIYLRRFKSKQIDQNIRILDINR